jgi:hypothetical protein
VQNFFRRREGQGAAAFLTELPEGTGRTFYRSSFAPALPVDGLRIGVGPLLLHPVRHPTPMAI